LAAFRKRLADELAAMFRQVRGGVREEMVPELFDLAGVRDEGDASLYDQLRDMRLSLTEGESRKARLIEGALMRMNRGEFGECIDCGRPIAPERLRLVPWTTRCVDCQDRAERVERGRPPTM
jgi:DnaK suppressor protein